MLQNRYVMLAISVVLAPVIEETLLRGLVFGSIPVSYTHLGAAAVAAADF